jgi:predicted amino acid dehydrogenase
MTSARTANYALAVQAALRGNVEGQQGQGIEMSSNNEKLIAVIGATGRQGGAVVRALQAAGQFKVRALSRNLGKQRELADEVVEADLDRPETLKAAFEGAHGVFLVTNFWEDGPTSASRQPRPCVLPSMPVSNTLSGQRCLM